MNILIFSFEQMSIHAVHADYEMSGVRRAMLNSSTSLSQISFQLCKIDSHTKWDRHLMVVDLEVLCVMSETVGANHHNLRYLLPYASALGMISSTFGPQ